MSQRYVDALDHQIGTLRWIQTPEGRRFGSYNYACFPPEWLRSTLAVAEPFYWSPQLCALLTDAAPGVPAWELREADALSPSGYMYFADPLPLPGAILPEVAPAHRAYFGPDDLRALAWREATTADGRRRGLLFYVFTRTGFRDGLPGIAWLWEYGTDIALNVGARFSPTADPDADEPYSAADQEARFTATLRYIAAAFAMCTEMLDAPRTATDRATRRRLARDVGQAPAVLADPQVRVVTLRRVRRSPTADPEAAPAEWSCQWMVRGHWRMQFYGTEGRHKAIYIAPFWKGPPSAPIKLPSARAFQVVR